MDITCETNPHYLEFTTGDIDRFGNLSKITPPLRTKEDRIFLWQAINSGLVDIVSSNHTPFEYSTEKDFDGANIWNTYSGTPETEFLLPYMFSEGYKRHRIDLTRLVQVLCENPAKRFGLFPKKGTISVGADADFAILDPSKRLSVKKEEMTSKAKYTLFDNRNFDGIVDRTVIRGNIIYADDRGLVKERQGRYIKRIRL